MRGRNRLVTFQARFHHTALVMAPGFRAVLVAEMDFDPGNVLGQVAQGAGHGGFSLLDECFLSGDVVVGVDLDTGLDFLFFVRFYRIETIICILNLVIFSFFDYFIYLLHLNIDQSK